MSNWNAICFSDYVILQWRAFMNVIQTLESISINTDDSSVFSQLQSMIKKNFKKSVGNKGKIISFYDESEKVQRKYFFKFLQNMYKKYHNKSFDFKMSEFSTIKLSLIQQNTLKSVVLIEANFKNSEVTLNIKNSDNFFISYINQCCNEWGIKFDKFENIITLNIQNEESLDMLDMFFNTKEIFNYTIDCNYDEKSFAKFKKEIKVRQSSKFIKRFKALANLLEEYFEILGCEKTDDSETVRSSYLSLIKLYHPDRHQNKPVEIQNSYREKFENIQKAYEALKPYFKEQENFISA